MPSRPLCEVLDLAHEVLPPAGIWPGSFWVRNMKRIIIASIILALLLASMPAHGDLSILDEYKDRNWHQLLTQTPGIFGPGMVVSSLPMSGDKEFLDSVQKVLDEYTYDQKYKLEGFDCTNSSQITWYILKEKGFDARLIYSNEIAIGRKDKNARDFYGHVWVVVPRNNYTGGNYDQYIHQGSGGWISVETTENYTKHLGLADDSDRPYGWFKPDVGWLFNSSIEYSTLTGDYYQLGSKDLHVREKA